MARAARATSASRRGVFMGYEVSRRRPGVPASGFRGPIPRSTRRGCKPFTARRIVRVTDPLRGPDVEPSRARNESPDNEPLDRHLETTYKHTPSGKCPMALSDPQAGSRACVDPASSCQHGGGRVRERLNADLESIPPAPAPVEPASRTPRPPTHSPARHEIARDCCAHAARDLSHQARTHQGANAVTDAWRLPSRTTGARMSTRTPEGARRGQWPTPPVNLRRPTAPLVALEDSFRRCLLAAFLGPLLLPGIGSARQIIVAPSGGDFATVAAGVGAAQAGDTVTVRGGIYYEAVSFGRSGSAAAFITLKGDPGATLDGTGRSGQGIMITSRNYIQVIGMTVQNFTGSGTPMGI